jgi:phage tail-like protein
MAQNDAYAMSTYFTAEVDGASLGDWDSVNGFGIKIAMESRESGGVGTAMTQLPGRYSYSNIHLKRAVCASTKDVMKWLDKFAQSARPCTAVITSRDADGKMIVSWNLDGVVPTSWTGPTFDVNSNQLATETLELAYKGFLD